MQTEFIRRYHDDENVLNMRSQQARAPTMMTLTVVAARCRLGEFLSGSVYANEGNGGIFFL